jgi:hypothetical protein
MAVGAEGFGFHQVEVGQNQFAQRPVEHEVCAVRVKARDLANGRDELALA